MIIQIYHAQYTVMTQKTATTYCHKECTILNQNHFCQSSHRSPECDITTLAFGVELCRCDKPGHLNHFRFGLDAIRKLIMRTGEKMKVSQVSCRHLFLIFKTTSSRVNSLLQQQSLNPILRGTFLKRKVSKLQVCQQGHRRHHRQR